MATAAALAIKVAEFQDSSNKLRSLLSYVRSSVNQLPAEEQIRGKQLKITLNEEMHKWIDFATEDLKANEDDSLKEVKERLEKLKKEMKSPAVVKAEIQNAYLQRKWLPSTMEEFFMYPYDIHRGIMQAEGVYGNSCRFHPRSLFSQLWCSIHSILIIAYAIMLPLGLAFDGRQEYLLPITLCLMVITAFDTFLVFNTGIIVEQELDMNKKEVFQFHWKKKTLFYNVSFGIPYMVLVDVLTAPGSVERKAWRLVCLINALCIPQMFTSNRVSLISEKITALLRQYEVNQSLTKSVYIVAGMAFYWHWFSCSVEFLQWFSILPDPYPLLEDTDHYAVFFFESASIMFSAAWGAVPPVATHDRLSKVGNMVISAFLLALFTANITTFMIRLDSSGRLFAEKMEEVNQYIQYKGLGRDIQQRILQYYHFKYSQGKYFDESKILAELNQPLRVSISMRECRPLIVQFPFFKDADHSFITQVVTILKVNHFLHDDFIIEQGTTGDQMFFIESGSVEVIVDGNSVAVLEPGEFFGEINLLFGHMKRTASIKAVTKCVLYSLSQSDLQGILEINPKMASKMRQIAEDRLRFNQACISVQKVAPGTNLVQFVDNSYGNRSSQVERPDVPPPNSPAFEMPSVNQIEKVIHVAKRNSFLVPYLSPQVIANSIVVAPPISEDVVERRMSVVSTRENSGERAVPSHGMPHSNDAKVSASQYSLEKASAADDVLNEIETQEIIELVKTTKRMSTASNFIGMNFLDSHVTSNPTQGGTETVIVETNGEKEQIEIHRKRKSKMVIETNIPVIPESSMSAVAENAPHLDFSQQPKEVPIDEERDEVYIMPGQTLSNSNSIGKSLSKLSKVSKSLASVNNEKLSDTKPSKLQSQSNLQGSKAEVNQVVPRSVKASREVLEEPRPEVKITMDDKDDDDDDLDAPKKVTTRKQMKQDGPDTPAAANKNFDDIGKEANLMKRLQRLWNKYRPSWKYAPLHPNLVFSRVWNSIFQVCFGIVAILLPLPFGFQSLRDMLPGISIFVLIVTLLDLIIKLQTGYAQFEEVEMEPAKLVRIYLKNGTFAFDFLTGFPWVFIIDAATGNNLHTQDAARLFCIVHGLPFFKSLLDSRRSYLSEQITEYVRKYDINISAVQAVKILFAIAFYWHWHSCSANFILRMGFVPNPYPDLMNFNAYTLHFWTSATEMLNAGCGAVPPIVTLDRWLKVCNMIFNCTLVALFVGNISSFMIGLDSSGRQFNEQLEQVSQYINYKGLGRELKKKILDYYQLKYSKGKYFDEAKILAELNHPLRLAIYMRECRALIIQVPFFKGADNGFISQVVMILKPAHFLPEDLVIEKGTAGDFMFFIASGNLEVMVDDRPVAELSPGQFFGEIALLFGHMKRTASIRAKTACSLYSLSRSDLDSILEVYPDMAEKLQKTAEERIAHDLQRNIGKAIKEEDE